MNRLLINVPLRDVEGFLRDDHIAIEFQFPRRFLRADRLGGAPLRLHLVAGAVDLHRRGGVVGAHRLQLLEFILRQFQLLHRGLEFGVEFRQHRRSLILRPLLGQLQVRLRLRKTHDIFIHLHEGDLLILFDRIALVHRHLGEDAFDIALDRIFAVRLQRAGGVKRFDHRAFDRFGDGDGGRGKSQVEKAHDHRGADQQRADREPTGDGAAGCEFPDQSGHGCDCRSLSAAQRPLAPSPSGRGSG